MRVAACQLPDVRDDLARATALMRDYSLEAARAGADLVCFPECFLQGYDADAERVATVAIDLASREFAEVLDAIGVLAPVVVFGLIERDGDHYYNCAVAVARGAVVARYRKSHLLLGEQSTFKPGTDVSVFELRGAKVGIGICYDLISSDLIERTVNAGAQLLACPCSNMMPRPLAEHWRARHNEIRAQHARDHGVWILSSDVFGERDDWISYGPTALIDPQGLVVAQVPIGEPGMLVTEISLTGRSDLRS